MCIKWYKEITGRYISLAIYGLTISKGLMEAMGNPSHIMMGLRTSTNIIMMKPSDGGSSSSLKITRRGVNSARIASRGLKKYLLSLGMGHGENRGGKKYEVNYNGTEGMGYINTEG